ncbi:hypothetical protein EDB85DRAFT_2149151 [Lactarius pseudohatsudake]|nr:hypothetical protein EDB85DRAFT_2149151 [Lactarius pseudohatsudake]
MDPTWHLSNFQQPMPANYPPPHTVAPHLGYLPHGVPYPPLTPGPTPPGPYLPTAHGYYGQQYQSFYAPYYAHPAPMPSPPHLASGVAGPVPVLMPMPTHQLPATPMRQPPATPARTPCGTGKRYVNSQCEPGVWEFDVSIASSEAKSIFKGHSAMHWDKLQTEVLKCLWDTGLLVQLGYKLSGDIGKMSYLSSEEEWEAVLTRLDAKITVARKNAVSIEIQNLTKPLSKVSKVSGSREKRRCQDDIPLAMTAEQQVVHQAFKELDITLKSDHINPPVRMLLELMDIHDPSPTFSYVDKESDLADFGMKTVMQVYGMHQVLLATVGSLGKEGARGLHAYVDKWLLLVIRPKGKGSAVGGRQEDVVAVEVEEVQGDRKDKGRILGRLLEEEHCKAILVSSDEEGEQKRQGQVKDEDVPLIEVHGLPVETMQKDASGSFD